MIIYKSIKDEHGNSMAEVPVILYVVDGKNMLVVCGDNPDFQIDIRVPDSAMEYIGNLEDQDQTEKEDIIAKLIADEWPFLSWSNPLLIKVQLIGQM